MTPFFEQEHEDFRATVRTFLEREAVPHHGAVGEGRSGQPRGVAQGRRGGDPLLRRRRGVRRAGARDFRYNMVVAEEVTRAGASGLGFSVHSDIIVPYISQLGTRRSRSSAGCPACVSGELVSAIAMTEPGAGSDLQGIATTAVDKGDHYVLNGSKTFISNGILSDLVIVVCRTDPDAGHQGISLLVVERGMPGFERGRNLEKVGLKAQDTAELFFDNVQVPKANLLGDEGSGFISLMVNLPQERISIAAIAVAACEHVLGLCLDYAKERKAFGRPIGSFQHNRFVLAEMATEVHIARVFVNDCVQKLNAGEVDTALASMAKWWTTELQKKVVDQGVQLFGGYGYMLEYPISQAFLDSRIQTIYGGTTEIQKEIIGRTLGLWRAAPSLRSAPPDLRHWANGPGRARLPRWSGPTRAPEGAPDEDDPGRQRRRRLQRRRPLRPAQADPPGTSCPGGQSGFVLWDVSAEPYGVDNLVDEQGNNDGWACAKPALHRPRRERRALPDLQLPLDNQFRPHG